MPTTYWARTDSNTANNPALNLTGASSVEITFVPFGSNGDIFLDANGGSFDPDTQVVINGTSYNFTYELTASLPTLRRDGARQVPEEFRGSDVIIVTVQDYPTAGETTRLAFLPDETATQVQMDAFGNGAISLQNISTAGPGVICFGEGTRLLTPDGERKVQELSQGDLVVTADHGAQPIVWASRSTRYWPGCPTDDLPVRIKAGAMAPGCPLRDLTISPQHKLLMPMRDGTGEARHRTVLAPAKGLTRLPGVRVMQGCKRITYYHILFARHEIVFSNGMASESFYPGPMGLRMLSAAQRSEIFKCLPGLKVRCYGPAARAVLSVREAREFVATQSETGSFSAPEPAHELADLAV